MRNLLFTHKTEPPEREEIVIVTSKQYLAVDDFLRKLFPELTPDLLPYPGPFTVFIADAERVRH